VLIIERTQVGKRFGVFRKYSQKRLFVGRLPVLHVLLYGLAGYMSYLGGRNFPIIEKEFLNIFNHARIDEMPYQVVDFFQKKGQLIIYVMTNKLSS
jgi:hypothetical protein